jgi:hypothetical protein
LKLGSYLELLPVTLKSYYLRIPPVSTKGRKAAWGYHARRALRRTRRRPTLVMAFWQQADLFPL